MNQPTKVAALAIAAAGLTLLILTSLGKAPEEQPEEEPKAPAAEPATYARAAEEVMGTYVEVMHPVQKPWAAKLVFDLFRDVDARMSEWKESSPLSAVNRGAGATPVEVPRALFSVIQRSLEISKLTDGAFDTTWAALWGLWDFKKPAPKVPDPAEVKRRAELVNYEEVQLDESASTIRLPRPGMKLGLGGIAKGYALEIAASALRERGLESFMISSGGQVLAGGRKGTKPWRVGVRDPRGSPDDFFAVIEAEDTSISTSGDYESFFMHKGIRYHHIIDPRTGQPARGLRSVTVITADATLADALSTALMVLGTDRAMALVEKTAGVEAVLVDDQAQMHVSSGLASQIAVRHAPLP